MNDIRRVVPYRGASTEPLDDPLDALLADIVINIQLPPGLHAKAVGRYEAVQVYLCRPGSPLAGIIVRLYPQGSMAIDATISTRGTDNEFDLDAVLELLVSAGTTPEAALDLAWSALKDYPVTKVVTNSLHHPGLLRRDASGCHAVPANRAGGN